jgi:hypothetical protein
MRAAIGVIVGFALWSVLWLGGNVGLALLYPQEVEAFSAGKPISTTGYFASALVLSVVCSFGAGRLNAAIAGRGSKRAVMIMAVLLLVTGAFIQGSAWSLMPAWYHLSFLGLLLPMCLAGGHKKNS